MKKKLLKLMLMTSLATCVAGVGLAFTPISASAENDAAYSPVDCPHLYLTESVCPNCLLDFGSPVDINQTTFPDEAFRTFVLNSVDLDDDNVLSNKEKANSWRLDLTNLGIKSLAGIEYFSALTQLYCYDNTELTTIDLSKNSVLNFINCANTAVSTLSFTNHQYLDAIYADNSALANLDISGCPNIKTLDLDKTKFTTLDISNVTSLESLSIESGCLQTLDASGCTALSSYKISNNPLQSIDLSGCTSIPSTFLYYNSQLTSLNLSGCTSLQIVDCFENALTTLNVSGCTNMYYLSAYKNKLTSLDLTDCPAIYSLSVGSNLITSLDLTGCPEITNFKSSWLDIDNTPLLALKLPSTGTIAQPYLNVCAYEFFTDIGSQINLTDLGVDGSKISYLTGATLNAARDVLTVNANTVTYTYDSGNENHPLKATLKMHEHTFKEYGYDQTQHWSICSSAQCSQEDNRYDLVAHSGGTATCINNAVCEVCSSSYGQVAPLNHTTNNAGTGCTSNNDGTHTMHCADCNKPNVALTENCVGSSVSNGDGTHNTICSSCNYVIAQNQTCNGTANCKEPAFCTICQTSHGEVGDHSADGNYYPNNDGTHSTKCAGCEIVISTENCTGGTASCDTLAVCATCGQSYGEIASENHEQECELWASRDGTHAWYYPCCGFADWQNCTYPDDVEYEDGVTVCTICEVPNLSSTIDETFSKLEEQIEIYLITMEYDIFLVNSIDVMIDLYECLLIEFDYVAYNHAYTIEDVNTYYQNAEMAIKLLANYQTRLSIIMQGLESSTAGDGYMYFLSILPPDLLEEMCSFILSIDPDVEGDAEEKLLTLETIMSNIERTANMIYKLDTMKNVPIYMDEYSEDTIPLKFLIQDILYPMIDSTLNQSIFRLLDSNSNMGGDNIIILTAEENEDESELSGKETDIMYINYNFTMIEKIVDFTYDLAETNIISSPQMSADRVQMIIMYPPMIAMQTVNHLLETATDIQSFEKCLQGEIQTINFLYDTILTTARVSDDKLLTLEDNAYISLLTYYQEGIIIQLSLCENIEELNVVNKHMEVFQTYIEDMRAEFKRLNANTQLTTKDRTLIKRELIKKADKAINALFQDIMPTIDPETGEPIFDEEAYSQALNPCNIGLHNHSEYTNDELVHKITCTRCEEVLFEEEHVYGDDVSCDVCGNVKLDSAVGVKQAIINENGHLIITLDDGTIIDAGKAVGPQSDKGDKGDKGDNGNDGVNGREVEFRTQDNVLQWRYVGETQWVTLFNLDTLKAPKEAGCRSALSTPIAMLTLLAIGGAVLIKKRK